MESSWRRIHSQLVSGDSEYSLYQLRLSNNCAIIKGKIRFEIPTTFEAPQRKKLYGARPLRYISRRRELVGCPDISWDSGQTRAERCFVANDLLAWISLAAPVIRRWCQIVTQSHENVEDELRGSNDF